MSRPKLCRRVSFRPRATYFKPRGIPLSRLEIVELTIEEMEAFRLRHIDSLEQTAAAKKMQTSQSTYQRILYSAYGKIADALVNGKAISISERGVFHPGIVLGAKKPRPRKAEKPSTQSRGKSA